jgi:hypothetical protein
MARVCAPHQQLLWPTHDGHASELALLHHPGNVDEFCSKFMALSCRDHTLTEGQQIQLFMTGLSEPLRIAVALPRQCDLPP